MAKINLWNCLDALLEIRDEDCQEVFEIQDLDSEVRTNPPFGNSITVEAKNGVLTIAVIKDNKNSIEITIHPDGRIIPLRWQEPHVLDLSYGDRYDEDNFGI